MFNAKLGNGKKANTEYKTIKSGERLYFIYKDAYGKISARDVEFKESDDGYLYCLCPVDDIVKTFAESRVLEYLSDNSRINDRLSYYRNKYSHSENNSRIMKSKKHSAKWHGPEAQVIIDKFTIPNAMLYFGDYLPSYSIEEYELNYLVEYEPSLIEPKLKIQATQNYDVGDELFYFPVYRHFSPICRFIYLKWLADGRVDPDINIGFVFLFFYGLERRLMIDGWRNGELTSNEHDSIINEIVRLKNIYNKSESFLKYANNLLAIEWILSNSSDQIPEYLNIESCNQTFPGLFQYIISRTVKRGEPLDAESALNWALNDEKKRTRLRTAARRCYDKFIILFKINYQKVFGAGLILKPGRKKFAVNYISANPALVSNTSFLFDGYYQPKKNKKAFGSLSQIIEKCTEELSSYSRLFGSSKFNPNTIASLALLPKDILNQTREVNTIKNNIENKCRSNFILISIKAIYEIIGKEMPKIFSKKEHELLSIFLNRIGYGLSPDPRYFRAKPRGKDPLVVFKHGYGVDFHPSPEFHLIKTVIRLGATVSLIDGDISSEEDLLLKNIIHDNRELSRIEKDALLAFLHWCLKVNPGLTGIKYNLSEVDDNIKKSISRILLSVAMADGRIDPKEISQLEKSYTLLGLDKKHVNSDLHNIIATKHTNHDIHSNNSHISSNKSTTIPVEAKGKVIDEALVRIRAEQTDKVKDVLDKVFSEDEDGDGLQKSTDEKNASNDEITSPVYTLDTKLLELFRRLIKKEEWDRRSVNDICSELDLMTDGAIESINDWAMQNSNITLIENGDLIYIDLELAHEIS